MEREEYITAEAATPMYGIKFGDLMRLADSGIIRRRHRVVGREETFTFNREDIIRASEDLFDDANA